MGFCAHARGASEGDVVLVLGWLDSFILNQYAQKKPPHQVEANRRLRSWPS